MKLDLEFIKRTTGLSVLHFVDIDSTNLYCKRRIKACDPFVGVVIADCQTNGQGRVGKSFYSPDASGLYLTFSLKKDSFFIKNITPVIALAVCEAIQDVFHLKCGLKWVNDVYFENRKIAGILCQQFDDFYLIGIGINLQKPEFIPDDLVTRMGWIADSVDGATRTDLIVSLYRNVLSFCSEQSDALIDRYRKLCIHIEKNVEIEMNNSVLRGKCIGIGDDFSLLMEIDGMIHSFTSGFMTLRI